MSLPHVPELLVILVIVLLIFGAGRLPEVAGSMGKAIREFRRNSQTEDAPTVEKDRESNVAESTKNRDA
ncbi:MAG: twin-arginine translocase TatA/TatE family subunit [Chloroflexi bacterium]|nr:twin-arginine translocase TatA/TatE family subunit [Chloroflexota bacterium]